MSNKKILVVIPSANDHMIIETINRMAEKAKNPENISLILSTEYSPGVFEEMFGVPQEQAISLIDRRIGSVQHVIIDPKFINGPCSTRNYLCNMKKNESYFLSIDAHTSFGTNWDENLINLYEASKKVYNKPLISGLLQIAISDKTIKKDEDFRLRDRSICNLYNSDSGEQKSSSWNSRRYKSINMYTGAITFEIGSNQNQSYSLTKEHKLFVGDKTFKYSNKPIICAQFIFTDISWIDEVNFSNRYTFKYEEPDISFRSYLAGYDIIDFETQFLSNLSISAISKDRSFKKYVEDYGYISFVDLLFSNNIGANGRNLKSWLQEFGIFFFDKNKNDTELKLDIQKTINR